jgi:hypothetical protein
MSLTNPLITGEISFNNIFGFDFRNYLGGNFWPTGYSQFTIAPIQVLANTQGPPREETVDEQNIEEEEEEWGVTPSER